MTANPLKLKFCVFVTISILSATSAYAHDVKSIFVKLFVAPTSVAKNPTDNALDKAWQNGSLNHARGDIYFQLKDASGQVIDQGKIRISSQGKLKKLSRSELAKASSIYVGTGSTGKIWQLSDGKPQPDGTAVLNFVVADTDKDYKKVSR